MENEPNAVDEFLQDLKNEPADDPFPSTETQGEEKTEVEGTGEEAKPLPFHKDPKIQKYIKDEISKHVPEPTPVVQPVNTDEIDEVLTRIIGNDSQEKLSAIKDFKKVLLDREERGAQLAYDRLKEEQEEQKRQEREAEESLNSGFETIEETFGVNLYANENKKLKGQFIDFVKKIAPKDEDGEIVSLPDLSATFETFQSIRKTQSTSKAKELADRSNERSSGETTHTEPVRRTWDSVEKEFERLGG